MKKGIISRVVRINKTNSKKAYKEGEFKAITYTTIGIMIKSDRNKMKEKLVEN